MASRLFLESCFVFSSCLPMQTASAGKSLCRTSFSISIHSPSRGCSAKMERALCRKSPRQHISSQPHSITSHNFSSTPPQPAKAPPTPLQQTTKMPRRLPRFQPVSMKTPIAHLSPSSRHRLRIRNPNPLTQIPTQYLPNDHLVQLHPMGSLESLPITQTFLHITPVEAIILIGTLGIMVALLAWLGWIIFIFVFQFVRDKIDDFNVGKRIRSKARRREREVENLPNEALEIGGKVAKGVGTVAKSFFDALTRNENPRDRKGGERRGLLNDGVNEEEPSSYGYYEGTVYQERGRYGVGDGTSESTGSGRTTVVHRDDCAGHCGETRKRSVEV